VVYSLCDSSPFPPNRRLHIAAAVRNTMASAEDAPQPLTEVPSSHSLDPLSQCTANLETCF